MMKNSNQSSPINDGDLFIFKPVIGRFDNAITGGKDRRANAWGKIVTIDSSYNYELHKKETYPALANMSGPAYLVVASKTDLRCVAFLDELEPVFNS